MQKTKRKTHVVRIIRKKKSRIPDRKMLLKTKKSVNAMRMKVLKRKVRRRST